MSRRKSSKKNKPAIKNSLENAGATKPPVSPELHSEDAALWAEVTKSLTPLKDDQDRLHFGPLLDEKPDLPDQWHAARNSLGAYETPKHGGNGQSPPAQKPAPAANPRQASPPAIPSLPDLGSFTRREMRQINSGRQAIEARLDLHGLRQAAAHVALKGFLVSAQSRDLRHVLVITGKGRSSRSDDLIHAGGDGYESGPEQGVLRRVVPLWLAEPDLRDLVSGYSEAPRRHGGEGALYVRLRRNK